MTTARSQRQRELAREIERHWRRRRTRQISFVVAGAAFLCAFFLLGRAFMPLVPMSDENILEMESTEVEQVAESPDKAEPLNEPEGADPPLPAGDGGMSFSLLVAAAVLGGIGGIALGVARLSKPDDETGGAP